MEANYFTILYWFFHTSTRIHRGCTRGPHPEPPSHLPPHTLLGIHTEETRIERDTCTPMFITALFIISLAVFNLLANPPLSLKSELDYFHFIKHCFREGNGTTLQYSCLENPMDRGAWMSAVHGVAEGRTQLSDFTFTFHFHALEKEMATHSSVLAWRIPGMEEPGGLPSMGSHRVGHD